jgi:glycine/D-amino acid oxidase-like deaminating enzyme
MARNADEVTIIGGGIQGATVALALAERGVSSTILERGPKPLGAASLRNEGKLHLGFVYALDRSGATATAMVEGALTFTPLLERWCGELDWVPNRSDRFAYVAVEGGLADPDELELHYQAVMAEIGRVADELGCHYLGDESMTDVVRGRGPAPGLRNGLASAWFETPERSVDPRMICDTLAGAIADEPRIELLTGHEVTGVERDGAGFLLDADTPSGRVRIGAPRVVNCSWESRLELDRRALGEAARGCYRVKHQVIVRGGDASGLRPLTMVQGPYGDLVPWPGGDTYISWYPVARTHFGDQPANSLASDPAVAAATLEQMARLVPGLAGFSVSDHGPGHIVAAGTSDIDDPSSGLHSRSHAGVAGSDGWWSPNSSKLTTAPLASERCAALVTDTSAGY